MIILKLKIVGSGGMSIIPSSFCKCKICEEARQKGGRYERLGPSLYIEDIKMLIDTPEDIAVACNRQNISEVKYLSISHRDPDHVKGIRIVEKIGYDFIKDKSTPVEFYALPEVIEDINQMNLDCLKYYGDILGCISVNETSHIEIDTINIDLINNNSDRNITFYVINENDKKVIVTHIDEMWGKSYGYYKELEKKLDNISFAYDGMEIIV